VDWNDPPKLNENEEDDTKIENVYDDIEYVKFFYATLVQIDFNLKSEIVHEKQTKLNVVLKVIFYESYCRGCVLYVLGENYVINKVKVVVFIFKIKGFK